ncbi:hypothetical protein BE21_20705 [Sorangium cellulosum]|uniref:Secreted protein n=1 Tax=Sorangium cellulosum TaxID=56 RepID=A0A150TWJ2_SORCE|nr:hypothetical protein BE21_20705 [Sorangium cellulosum]
MTASIGISRALLGGFLAISSTSGSAAQETADIGREGETAGVSDNPENEAADEARRGSIMVIEATYGANCGTPAGNQTYNLARACNGLTYCQYAVDHRVIGDPAYGCAKEYYARWQCGRGDVRSTAVPAEASGRTVTLQCQR